MGSLGLVTPVADTVANRTTADLGGYRIPLPPHRRSGRSPDRPGLSVLAGTSVPLGSPPNRRIRDRCCQRCCQTWCLIRTLRCGRTAGSARWRPSQTARGHILTLRRQSGVTSGCLQGQRRTPRVSLSTPPRACFLPQGRGIQALVVPSPFVRARRRSMTPGWGHRHWLRPCTGRTVS
jgi:hypothetical protein